MNILDHWVEMIGVVRPGITPMQALDLRNQCFKKYTLGGTVDDDVWQCYMQWRTFRELMQNHV